LRIAAPRDEATLRLELREAVAIDDGPTIVRFPTGSVPGPLPALRSLGPVDVVAESDRRDVLLVTVGSFAHLGVDVAARLHEQGYGVTVADPRWVRPAPKELVDLAAAHRLVVVVEDGVRAGGVGSAVSQLLGDHDVDTPVREIGIDPGWYPHGTRAELLADLGLTAQDVARRVTEWVSRMPDTRPAPTDRQAGGVKRGAPAASANGARPIHKRESTSKLHQAPGTASP
jgi:1-deoxy-D-xylulose-5-phosphate synthase